MDDDDFEFGEMPDDDEENGLHREDYDAVNDETFGGGGETFGATTAADLEDYATQTACLRLDDVDWSAGNGGAAPDASQLPMPAFDLFASSSSTANASQHDDFSLGQFGKLDPWNSSLFPWNSNNNMWNNNAATSTAAAAAPKVEKDALDFWNNTGDTFSSYKLFSGQPESSKSPQPPPPSLTPQPPPVPLPAPIAPSTSAPTKLPKLPTTATTLEELEQQMIAASRPQVQARPPPQEQAPPQPQQPQQQQQHQPTPGQLKLNDLGLKLPVGPSPSLPPLPSGVALSAEDLERQMLNESARRQAPPPSLPMQIPGMPPTRLPPPPLGGSLPGSLPPGPPPNLPPPMGYQMGMPPGRPPLMQPPPLPPLPPQAQQMFAQFMPYWVESVIRKQQPPPYVPPIPPLAVPYIQRVLLMRGKFPMPGGPGGPMGPPPPAHLQQQWMMHQQSQHQQPRYSRKQGMPSGKTIEDFALNPFAGMMSCKEREWLVKVHSLQCQGCGNPYEDDFYYTCWKQRKLTETEEGKKEARKNGLTSDMDLTATAHGHHYVPPKFAGSLGKPTLSTSACPRQLIDVRNKEQSPIDNDDTVSEISEVGVVYCLLLARSTAQRRLRTLLIFIESAAMILMECDDRKRQLAAGVSEDVYEQLKKEIISRVELLRSELCSDGMLPKILTISKGRGLFVRLLVLAPKPQQIQLLRNLFEAMPSYNRRLYPLLSDTFVVPTNGFLLRYTREHLINTVAAVPAESVATGFSTGNTFCRDLLAAILAAVARKKLPASTAPVLEYLASAESAVLPGLATPARTLTSLDLESVIEYLKFLSPQADTRAQQLAVALHEILASSNASP